MVKSYFLLYKRAKKLLDDNKVKLTEIKEDKDSETYYFQSNGHQVSLRVSKIPNTRLWLRNWSCDCESYSLWQDKAECKHIISCVSYLVGRGGNPNKRNSAKLDTE